MKTSPIRGLLKAYLPICSLAMMLIPGVVHASGLVIPEVAPGTTYRYLFVTDQFDTVLGTSSNISTYNTFVNNVANNIGFSGSVLASLNTTWVAIASTESVSAFSNIGGFFTDDI